MLPIAVAPEMSQFLKPVPANALALPNILQKDLTDLVFQLLKSASKLFVNANILYISVAADSSQLDKPVPAKFCAPLNVKEKSLTLVVLQDPKSPSKLAD